MYRGMSIYVSNIEFLLWYLAMTHAYPILKLSIILLMSTSLYWHPFSVRQKFVLHSTIWVKQMQMCCYVLQIYNLKKFALCPRHLIRCLIWLWRGLNIELNFCFIFFYLFSLSKQKNLWAISFFFSFLNS